MTGERLDLEEGKRLLSEAAAGPWFIGPATDDTILAEDYAGCVVSRPLLDTFVEFWRAHPEDDPPMPIATDPLVANTYADNAAFGDDESHPHAKANVNAIVWLRNNADALVAAAEEAEKLREMGCAATAWHQRRFPTATQERVALKLAEEAGEVCGAVIAATSGNEHPERAEKVGPEAADTLIVLLVLLGRWYPEIDLIGEVAAKLQRLNVALTPPEPLSAQQETYT